MARSLNEAARSLNEGSNSAGMIDHDALKRYVGRGLNLRKAQAEIASDLKDLCAEADDAGVCSKKELRRLIKIAGMEQDVFEAQREREDMLVRVLGDFASLPLGEAAVDAAKPKRERKSKAQPADAFPQVTQFMRAVEAAQAHLDAGGEFEDEPPGAA